MERQMLFMAAKNAEITRITLPMTLLSYQYAHLHTCSPGSLMQHILTSLLCSLAFVLEATTLTNMLLICAIIQIWQSRNISAHEEARTLINS